MLQPDIWVPMQLISQMLRSVQALHWACYAHRNIKPSNILRRLKQHDWILTDFDSAAPLGATPLSISTYSGTRNSEQFFARQRMRL